MSWIWDSLNLFSNFISQSTTEHVMTASNTSGAETATNCISSLKQTVDPPDMDFIATDSRSCRDSGGSCKPVMESPTVAPSNNASAYSNKKKRFSLQKQQPRRAAAKFDFGRSSAAARKSLGNASRMSISFWSVRRRSNPIDVCHDSVSCSLKRCFLHQDVLKMIYLKHTWLHSIKSLGTLCWSATHLRRNRRHASSEMRYNKSSPI